MPLAPARRLAAAAVLGTALGLAAPGLTAPAGAAPLARETCVPIPGVPCLPDLPLPDAAPVATTPAAITGTPKVDEVLTAVEPTWDDPLTMTTYQWQRAGTAIDGATGSTYTVRPGDIGAAITVAATGTVAVLFSTVSTSAPVVGVIGDAPVATSAPSITGSLRAGETLLADPGTWAGTPTPTFRYQWYRSQGGTRVVAIAGADEAAYDLTTSDAGRRLAVLVTAARPGHTPTPTAAITGVVARLATTSSLSTTKKQVTAKQRVRVTVAVASAGGGVPSGRVVVRDGARKVGTGTASATTGKVTVRLKRLARGTHRLVATYVGSRTYARSSSDQLVVTVRR